LPVSPVPPPVNKSIAGARHIERDRFRRVLGQTCFDTWVGFLWRRDPDGTTRVRNATIAEAKGLSIHQVKRACRRLILGGLLEELSSTWGQDRRMVLRRVLGDYRADKISIPETAWRKVAALKLKGGARGPAISIDRDDKRSALGDPNRRALDDDPIRALPENEAEAKRADCPAKRAGWGGKARRLGGQSAPHESVEREERMGSSPSSPCSEEEDRSRVPREVLRQVSTDQEIGFGGGFRRPYLLPANGVPGFLPPYPDNQRMQAARLRGPPLLPADLSRAEQAWRLVYAYRGAVERAYRLKKPIFAGTDVRRSPHYAALVEGAAVLLQHQIPPIAWACWSVETWRASEGRQAAKPPPVTWVFGADRISKRRGWFGREASAYDGGRVFQGPLQVEYRQTYKLLEARLGRLGEGAPEAAVRAMVREHFPDGWDEQIRAARDENARTQAALDREVARGKWYW
jgi:hypothetical protein